MGRSMILGAPEKHIKRYNSEKIHKYRTEFERDRDRILYSKAFRRLGGKTQIFLPLSHDHVRNRLTHTLEVNQIAQVTARNLALNEDLTEAIALGHDLGHTPFGHIGERTLNLVLNDCIKLHPYFEMMANTKKGFKHNLHGLRVACNLEKTYRIYPGMNLTNFTLWGIKNHSKPNWDKKDNEGNLKHCDYFFGGNCFFPLVSRSCDKKQTRLSVGFFDQYDDYVKALYTNDEAWSFEALIVSFADEIAQRHHDIEDGLFMKIISIEELKEVINTFFGNLFDNEDKKNFKSLKSETKEGYFLPLVSRFVVNFLNKWLIRHSKKQLTALKKTYGIQSRKDFLHSYPNMNYEDAEICIGFPEGLVQPHKDFKEFLKNRLLNSFETQRMDGVGTYIIRQILKAYLTNPRQLPSETLIAIENIHKGMTGQQTIQDFTPAQIGKLRDEIDALSKKASQDFQCNLLRGICDHIAGMTDKYALSEYQKLYGVNFDMARFT